MTEIAPTNLMELAEVKKEMFSLTRAAQRYGTTDDIADIVLLVVQERSRWITGQFVSASGRMTG